MKLFKKDSTLQRIYKYVEEFQRATQNNDYRAARDAVEKALKIDPDNKELLDMKHTVLELVQMQNKRERPPLSDVAYVITKTEVSNTHHSAEEGESVEAILQLYGKALIAGDADAAMSIWDESSPDLTYVSTDHGAIRKGYREIEDAIKYAISNYDYMTYALAEHSEEDSNLVFALYEVRVARLWDAYADIPGCKRVTLILRKRGRTWKIVHGHESAFSCLR